MASRMYVHRDSRRSIRRLGLIIVVLGLLGLIWGVLSPGSAPTTATRHLVQDSARLPFVHLIAASAAHANAPWDVGADDAIADRVYGQADFTSAAALDPPTAASLHQPGGIAIYWSGHVFVSDTRNHRVLIWNNLETFEDGAAADLVIGQPDFTSNTAMDPPTASSLNAPTGLAVDEYGTLYVADSGNHRVLVYEPEGDDPDEPIYRSGMAASMVIGQPDFTSNRVVSPPTAASLHNPVAVAIDSQDNLVVADRDNHRVLIFDAPFLTAMPASYVIGQLQPGSIHFGNFTTNNMPSVPDATALKYPSGVAIGLAADELYVADTGHNRVLVFTKSHPIDAQADYVIGQPNFTSANVAAPSATSLNAPTGLSIDNYNRLYVSDTGNNRVLFYSNPLTNPQAEAVFGQPDFTSATANQGGVTAASLHAPVAVATDFVTMGVFITDSQNNRVLAYHRPQQHGIPLIKELFPGTVRVGRGDLTVEVMGAGIAQGTSVQVNGTTRATSAYWGNVMDLPIHAADLSQTGTLTLTLTSPNGHVSPPAMLQIHAPAAGDTIADRVLGQVGLTNNEGSFRPTAANTLYLPEGVVLDPRSGRIFVADAMDARVVSWPSLAAFEDGAAADLVIGQPDFIHNDWCVLDEDDCRDGTRSLGPFAGLTLDQAGNLYVADTENSRVLIYRAPLTSNMVASVVIGQPDFTSGSPALEASATNLYYPFDVALDQAGNLYVADTYNNRVLFYPAPLTSGMAATRVFGQPDLTSNAPNNGGVSAATLDFPTGIALDAAGNLYIADQSNHRVLVYTNPLTGDTSADYVFGQQGSFTTNEPNRGGLSAESLYWPSDMTTDQAGNLYIADNGNNRVLVYLTPLTTDMRADMVFGQQGSFTSNAEPEAVSAETLHYPSSVAVSADGTVVIVDNLNSRVLVYDQPLVASGQHQVYLPLVRR
ncbi:NHL repeat-containing protein [Candidatus Viridilinea mediisalina]|uniref:Teneurin NHL domain-containing protein n=1 Tax=Candidatus Viridilinea mediisalina TaxID=2024553 RepID=A0A2A6RGI1_9CHLR|nr:NHL repeat-containing protein [Candidatus Viridilinea mediisalina]PDW01988.1 hypothetical protein CJ255_16250 [Candidatus Viridilinea mediisalina]